jgi:hypothetical protein
MNQATSHPNIRSECLRPGESWVRPNGDEIREVLRLSGLTGSQAAKVLALGMDGGRTVRRWTGGDSLISFANWAILCDFAGLGTIWKNG